MLDPKGYLALARAAALASRSPSSPFASERLLAEEEYWLGRAAREERLAFRSSAPNNET